MKSVVWHHQHSGCSIGAIVGVFCSRKNGWITGMGWVIGPVDVLDAWYVFVKWRVYQEIVFLRRFKQIIGKPTIESSVPCFTPLLPSNYLKTKRNFGFSVWLNQRYARIIHDPCLFISISLNAVYMLMWGFESFAYHFTVSAGPDYIIAVDLNGPLRDY